jgi:hypothetical protein
MQSKKVHHLTKEWRYIKWRYQVSLQTLPFTFHTTSIRPQWLGRVPRGSCQRCPVVRLVIGLAKSVLSASTRENTRHNVSPVACVSIADIAREAGVQAT